MTHSNEESVLIRRAPEEVFAFISDIPRTPEWRSQITQAGWVDPPPTRVGRGFEAMSKLLGKEFRFDCVVSKWDPPRGVSYRVVEGPAQMEVDYRSESAPGGCRFTMSAKGRARGPLLTLFEPLIARILSRQLRQGLGRLQMILESGEIATDPSRS